ncbi:MAG TPA: hypothetical protein VGH89_43375 [Pseudonocardia sp.]|jgi:hypothetical protein
MADRLEVTRTVDVPAEQLFALLRTPSRHAEMDGAGMVGGVEDGVKRVRGVGDEFIMNMHNPVLGDYQTKNTVVTFEANLAIGWASALHPEGSHADKLGDMKPGGHTYTWHLFPQGSATRITLVYDWSEVQDPQFRALLPLLNEEQLGESIEKAARASSEG